VTTNIDQRKEGAFRLKKLMAKSSKCTGCGNCEIVCSKAWNKAEDKEKSAIRISADDQDGYTIAVCDQCGECMDMCSVIALTNDKYGVVRLDKKTCVGCLICVSECLRDFMFYHDDLPTPFKCIACGLCVKECPSGALSIIEE
jgi:Fe-S-cluster-containing hydrogenase component 2